MNQFNLTVTGTDKFFALYYSSTVIKTTTNCEYINTLIEVELL